MATPIQVDGIPAEITLAKEDYTELAYSQEDTLILLEEILKLSNTIQSDVDQVTSNFSTLQGKYDEFTDFNEHMNKASGTLQKKSEEIAEKVTQIMQVLSANLNELVKYDETLQDDIDALNSLMANGELPETFGYLS